RYRKKGLACCHSLEETTQRAGPQAIDGRTYRAPFWIKPRLERGAVPRTEPAPVNRGHFLGLLLPNTGSKRKFRSLTEKLFAACLLVLGHAPPTKITRSLPQVAAPLARRRRRYF